MATSLARLCELAIEAYDRHENSWSPGSTLRDSTYLVSQSEACEQVFSENHSLTPAEQSFIAYAVYSPELLEILDQLAEEQKVGA